MNMTSLRAVQRLARSGDTERAWELFEASDLSAAGSVDALSLKARLIKDKALKAAGGERAALFGEARDAYLAAAAVRPATYPLINAATIELLAGNHDEARRIADHILGMLDSGEHEPETGYWLKATRAEAHLLHGREAAARQVLAEAVRAAPAAWEDHASTLRHFRLILDKMNASSDWLDAFRPPATLHFSGIIHLWPEDEAAPAAIAEAIGAIDPGFAFGALAAGTDIIAAEELVRRNVDLHVILPSSVQAFRRDSVGRFGADWLERFDRLLDQAGAVETVSELDEVSEAGIVMGDQIAMGLAIRQARILQSHAVALRIGAPQRNRAASQQLDTAWEKQGLPLRRVDVRRSVAPSAQLPSFACEAVVALPDNGPVDVLVAAGGVAGDARAGYVVVRFADPVAAARGAIEVASRVSIPLGLDYAAFDPDEAGSDRLDLARIIARIATPGRIFLSRPIAVALTVLAPDFRCENYGEIATPHGEIALSILVTG